MTSILPLCMRYFWLGRQQDSEQEWDNREQAGVGITHKWSLSAVGDFMAALAQRNIQGKHLHAPSSCPGLQGSSCCAGSERVGRSEATGDRLEEAKHINRSLSALGDVMAALAQRNTKHVPFRNSKLTQLLQDSLCGQAKAMMFIHIAPEVMHPG